MEYNTTTNIKNIDVELATFSETSTYINETPYLTSEGVGYSSAEVEIVEEVAVGFRIPFGAHSVSGRIAPVLVEDAPAAVLKAVGLLNWEAAA